MANVCETCGDKGWEEALVFCDSCKLGAVHRYCCGITPVPIDGYVTWFCDDCDESDSASESTRQVELEDTSSVEVSSSPPTMEETGTTRDKSNDKKKKKKKKKKRKMITLSVPDATVDDTVEVSTKNHDGSENGKSDGSDKSRKQKKKKKKADKGESSSHFSLVSEADEGHDLQGTTTSVEPMEVSTEKSDELVGLERNELSVSEKSGKKKKKKKRKTDKGEEEKKNEEGSNNTHFSPVLEAEGHELQATTTSVEPVKESKKRKSSESKESEVVSVLEKSAKKKKSEERSTHTSPVQDAQVLQVVTSVEAMKESTMPSNEVSVVEKTAKKKKKKKRSESEENSNHSSPVLKAVDSGHQDTTSVEVIKESKKNKTSVSRESDELSGSVLEKSEKKKEKRNEERSNHTASVLDTTSVEAIKESKKHKTSASKESVLQKSEKEKKKKTNEESSNHTAPVLAAKENVADAKDNVEPEKAQESSASRKPTELAGLETNGASVSEGGNSTNVTDHTSCTTSKKRRLSPDDNMQVTSVNMELPANNISRKEAESNMPQSNELIPAPNNDRAQPFSAPVWRGSVTVKQGNVCSIHGLVAHLSTLASPRVYEKACSLRARLSAEMFPRLEIWPPSFLKNGPPTDESIALYFFPPPDSDGEKVYYSLVDEMKKKDLAMRCLLDDVELLLFTSYQLPLPLWKFNSKEYLWGVFRRGKTSGH